MKEVSEKDIKVTLSKYDLYPGTCFYWMHELLEHGEGGLNHQTTWKREERIRQLEKENE